MLVPWTAQAWETVSPSTTPGCFKNEGFQHKELLSQDPKGEEDPQLEALEELRKVCLDIIMLRVLFQLMATLPYSRLSSMKSHCSMRHEDALLATAVTSKVIEIKKTNTMMSPPAKHTELQTACSSS